MAKKTDTTNTFDVDEIARQDDCLGQFLRLLLDLPRPLPRQAMVKMLGDLKRLEGHIRQSAIGRRRAAEQRERDKLHEAELKPLRDELAAYAETLRGAGEMNTMPYDISRLADHAARGN